MVKWLIDLDLKVGSKVVVNARHENGNIVPHRCMITSLARSDEVDDGYVSRWDDAEVHDLDRGETYNVPLQLCRPEGMPPEEFDPILEAYIEANPMTDAMRAHAKDNEVVEAHGDREVEA